MGNPNSAAARALCGELLGFLAKGQAFYQKLFESLKRRIMADTSAVHVRQLLSHHPTTASSCIPHNQNYTEPKTCEFANLRGYEFGITVRGATVYDDRAGRVCNSCTEGRCTVRASCSAT